MPSNRRRALMVIELSPIAVRETRSGHGDRNAVYHVRYNQRSFYACS